MEQGIGQHGTKRKDNQGRNQQRSPPEVPRTESTKLSAPPEKPPKEIDLPDICAAKPQCEGS